MLLGDIAGMRSMLPFPFRGLFLSVTFAHCAQTAEDIDTISFVHDSNMSLPDRAKIWLSDIGQPFPPQICAKVTHPSVAGFERRRHSMANCCRMASAMVTMDSL